MKVKFWPKSSGIPVTKCAHRYGAVMTFSHESDSRFYNSIYAVEMYGFRNNVRLGNFVTNLLGQYIDGISESESTGLMRHDIYFATDMWRNPNTGVIEYLPDYYATAWTSAGASFFNVVAGASKVIRYPNNGQQTYDISSGLYGYDFVSDSPGISNLLEFVSVVGFMKVFLQDAVGRTPGAASYRNGERSTAELQYPYWLGIRNSASSTTGNADTWYGESYGHKNGSLSFRNYFINYPSTTRWWDSWNGGGFTKDAFTTYVQSQMAACISSNGWYRDFCHWHSAKANGTIASVDELLGIIRTAAQSNFIWTCSNGEALEYMFVRDLCKRVNAVDRDNQVTIITDIVDEFAGATKDGVQLNIPLNTINIPLSVEIDLTGTSLEGLNIVSNKGKIISLGSDVYIVQIPFNQREQFQTVILSEGANGYYTTTVPTASLNTDGSVLTVTTNIPTKGVLFGVTAGGNDYDSMPEQRTTSFATIHSFTLEATKDYRIGIISEFGQADLIEV